MFSNLGEYYSWEFSSIGWKCDCDQIYQKCWNNMAIPTWNDTYISPEWSKHNWQWTKFKSLRWVFRSISFPALTQSLPLLMPSAPSPHHLRNQCIWIVSQNQFSNGHLVSAWRKCAPCMNSGENKQTFTTFFLKLMLFFSFQVDVLDIYYFCLNRIPSSFCFWLKAPIPYITWFWKDWKYNSALWSDLNSQIIPLPNKE